MKRRSLSLVGHLLLLIATSFVCALLWAKASDPFQRFHFKTGKGEGRVSGMVVLSKPVSKRPVVVYLEDARVGRSETGLRLRQLAELGVAAVALECNPTNQTSFDEQFRNGLDYIRSQPWALPEAAAWFGCGLGAQRLLSMTDASPPIQPSLVVCLGGADSVSSRVQYGASTRFLLVHGQADYNSSKQDIEALVAGLRRDRAGVDLVVLPGQGHHFGSNQDLVYRGIAEYLATSFGLAVERNAPTWWTVLWWLPTVVLGGWLLGRVCRRFVSWSWEGGAPMSGKAKLLYALVSGLAALALAQTCLQLLLPAMNASPRTLATARRLIVRADQVSDHDYLVAQLNWTGESVRSVLQHVGLAGLQRRMFYSDLPEDYFLKYVLSPDVGGQGTGNWGWRRILWEAFYPRVRKEVAPAAAADIVVRFLRERVTVDPSYVEADATTIAWQRGRTSDAGFERLYIAALRSTGIAARLGENLRAQLWDGEKWVAAPQPLFREELPRREAAAQP